MAEPTQTQQQALAMIAAAVREDDFGTRVLADVKNREEARDVAFVLAWMVGASLREVARLLDVTPDEAVESLRGMVVDGPVKPTP